MDATETFTYVTANADTNLRRSSRANLHRLDQTLENERLVLPRASKITLSADKLCVS